MRNVIRKELREPGTAFVSPAAMFTTDWNIFEDESRFLNVRFAHSEHSEDFGSMFGYELTSGFNEHFRNAVYRRGEIPMESGGSYG